MIPKSGQKVIFHVDLPSQNGERDLNSAPNDRGLIGRVRAFLSFGFDCCQTLVDLFPLLQLFLVYGCSTVQRQLSSYKRLHLSLSILALPNIIYPSET